MKRFLNRDKPKQEVIEHLVRSFYAENPKVDRAVIEIKADKMTRSDKQNKLYWMWAKLIGDELGYTKDEVHVLLGDKFLEKITVEGKHKTIEQIPSTTSLKVSEFTEYLSEIDHFMAEYGITLPHPEDLYYDSMGYK